jgi:hypothetical protein
MTAATVCAQAFKVKLAALSRLIVDELHGLPSMRLSGTGEASAYFCDWLFPRRGTRRFSFRSLDWAMTALLLS